MSFIRCVLFFFLILIQFPLWAQNGKIIAENPFQIPEKYKSKLYGGNSASKQLFHKYSYLKRVVIKEVKYLSDGLKVSGVLLYPEKKGKYPCIIFNRGGNRQFGAINAYKLLFILARITSWGYVVTGSQYRGNCGGEGQEEFGGCEVNDILNLIPLLESLPNTDPSRIGIYGWSRGGMMTYLTLARTRRISAAVIGGGLSDLFLMKNKRPEMEDVYSELIPDYSARKDSFLKARSALFWPEKINKSTPLLLLHGSADWRVPPQMALDMARALLTVKHPFRLVLLEGGDHGLNEHDNEIFRLARSWFDRFVRNQAPLPNMEPHGK